MNYKRIKDFYKKNKKEIFSAIIGFFIVINIVLLSKYISYAYYHINNSFAFVNTKVGNFYIKDHDVSLLIFIEENVDTNKYRLVEKIPGIAYVYSGYKCLNDSVVHYDDVNKSASVTFNTKDVCSVYFNLVSEADIKILYMVETDVATNEYKQSSEIPAYGYVYDNYSCDHDSPFEYNSELHSVKIQTQGKETCRLFFKKKSADISILLYVEDENNLNNYVLKNNIPSNVQYILNNEKSICQNHLGEKIYNNITYEDGFINLVTKEISYCNVYLKVINE